jgi:hypothetical protein
MSRHEIVQGLRHLPYSEFVAVVAELIAEDRGLLFAIEEEADEIRMRGPRAYDWEGAKRDGLIREVSHAR